MSLDSVIAAFARTAQRTWAGIRRHPWAVSAAVLAAVPVALALYVAAMVPLTPSIGDIRKIGRDEPSRVLSADGHVLATFRLANRERVKLKDVSPHVLHALIATEDRRFYDHHGLDLKRTAGAALRTLGGDLQGGSTITQQLARNLYPDDIGRAPTLSRKVKEAITAVKIESVYSKDEILETYLNTVPFLYNAYGIEMAARTYFDKSARDLDVLESATLIGMLKGTRHYNPVLNPERSTQRRNIVLAQMARHGKLDAAQLEELKSRPLALDFERQGEDLGPAPHVAQQLKRWLIEWGDREGYNIYADGLVLHTTIDSRLQAMAQQAVTRQGDKLQLAADGAYKRGTGWKAHKALAESFIRETPKYQAALDAGTPDGEAVKHLQADAAFMLALWDEKTRLQAGFLALDPTNGHVKAWVGSRDFNQDNFDHVQQARRQPGSTFKPFVYGAAFEQGIPTSEAFVDGPVEIRIDEKNVWRPGDVGESTGLPMTLREGLMRSKNSITSQLMERVGPQRVAQVAYAMGVRHSKLDAVPSLALGTSPVTLKEMVTGFGSIANSGSYIEPVLVTRVADRNRRTLQEFHAKAPERAMDETAAQTLLDVMRGVIDQGTGAGVRSRFGLQGDLAGKTGTTQSNTDGWFILMHPQLVGGAWVGFNDNRVTMKGNAWGQGAHNALNVVGDFFQQAVKAKVIDAKAKFSAPHDTSPLEPLPVLVPVEEPSVVLAPVQAPAPPAVPVPAQPQVFRIERPAQVLRAPPVAPPPAEVLVRDLGVGGNQPFDQKLDERPVETRLQPLGGLTQ
ncbi:MAG TPA: transglycosylase domain-containing protein [Ramlibacter sp.]|nr:transglycosylase domain-containing protein [Ramlibacter sp.]